METEKEIQHWFTISSAPAEGTVNISTHSLGGKFVWEEDDESRVALVAAGIGITPFRSILTGHGGEDICPCTGCS